MVFVLFVEWSAIEEGLLWNTIPERSRSVQMQALMLGVSGQAATWEAHQRLQTTAIAGSCHIAVTFEAVHIGQNIA